MAQRERPPIGSFGQPAQAVTDSCGVFPRLENTGDSDFVLNLGQNLDVKLGSGRKAIAARSRDQEHRLETRTCGASLS